MKTQNAHGFTLIEVLIVVAIIGILAAIAVPSMLRARLTANESAAIASLRTINSAQAAFAATAGNGSYAPALSVLAQTCPNTSQAYLSSDLGSDPSVKTGYTVTLGAASSSTPGPLNCHGGPTVTDYYATAVPLTTGVSGHRGFATTAAGTVFYDNSGAAPSEAAMAPGGGGLAIQ